MENQNISIKQIVIKYGLMLVGSSFAVFGISYTTDNYIDTPWWVSLLNIIITTVILVYAFVEYKKNTNNGSMSFAQAIKIGLGISLITGFAMGVFRYIFINVIDPDFIKETVELFKIHHPDVPLNIEEGKGMMQVGVMSIIKFITTSFLGLFISLILGLIMRTKTNSKL